MKLSLNFIQKRNTYQLVFTFFSINLHDYNTNTEIYKYFFVIKNKLSILYLDLAIIYTTVNNPYKYKSK